jgi:hypothetical protein
MLRSSLGGLVVLAFLAGPGLAQPKGKPEAIPGYTIRTIEGFTVLISDQTLKEDAASKLQRKPLEVLAGELKALGGLMPARTLKALHNVLIWVEWDEEMKVANGRPGNVLATYFGGHQLAMLAKGMHPLKARNVTIHRMKELARLNQRQPGPGSHVILHEVAHAVHDQVIGFSDPDVKAAYKQAMERHLVDPQAYAATNEREFFAEMTCAYYGRLPYYPHTNEELKKHDPVTFKLLQATWGKPKPGAAPKAVRGGPDADLLLEKVGLGQPVSGPKVAPADLEGRAALVVIWHGRSPSSLTFLAKASAWDAELRDFGLATVGVHSSQWVAPPVDVAAVAKGHGVTFPITDSQDNRNLVTEFRDLPVAVVFGHTGRCVYRGSAYDAEKAVRAAVGEALAARAGFDSPSKALGPVLEALQKGKPPASVLPRVAQLARAPDADTAAAAKTLLGVLTAGGLKVLEEAQALAKDDKVGAFLLVERLPAAYKETAIASKASELIGRLKADRAVVTELRARAGLAAVKTIDTELGGRPGSFDPAQEKFRTDNAALLRRLAGTVAAMKKSWPKARATEEALRIAQKYGVQER